MTNIALAAAAAAAQAAGEAADSQASELSATQAQQAASSCGDRRFESVAEAVVDGESRRAKILLCAKPTDSNEQWAQTLEKAAAQLADSETLSAESKAKLSLEFQVAIADAREGRSPGAATGVAGLAAVPGLPTPAKPSLVKPLAPQDRLEATVPPLPPPLPATSAATAAAKPALSLLTAPRVSLRCLETGERGDGMECLEVRANTTLVLEAQENLGRAASVHFIREGESYAEVDLGQLRRGQVRRLRVPAEVCRGIVRGELRLDIVPALPPSGVQDRASAQRGPFDLRC